MDVVIRASFLSRDDPDASAAFYCHTRGVEFRNDLGCGAMRWITRGPAVQPGTSRGLAPPAADAGRINGERLPLPGAAPSGGPDVLLEPS